MNNDASSPIIEVGRKNTIAVQRKNGHINVTLRPSKKVMREAAYLAKQQYGPGSQTYQSIVCRMKKIKHISTS